MTNPSGSTHGTDRHPAGPAGQRGGFLEECRDLGDPRRLGQRGGNGVSKPPRGEADDSADPIDPALVHLAGVNKFTGNAGQDPLLTRGPERGRVGDAHEVYLERLAAADDLGMDTSAGSPAEATARREADRVIACVPFAWPHHRGPDGIDITLRTLAPVFGALTFVRFEGGTP